MNTSEPSWTFAGVAVAVLVVVIVWAAGRADRRAE